MVSQQLSVRMAPCCQPRGDPATVGDPRGSWIQLLTQRNTSDLCSRKDSWSTEHVVNP